jgi:hypothetical protein
MLKQAKLNGSQLACMNNLKQIGLSSIMYSQDYSDYISPACTYAGTGWDLNFKGYMGNSDGRIFKCPFDNLKRNWSYEIRSYSMNSTLAQKDWSIKLNELRIPASTIFIAELHNENNWRWVGNCAYTTRAACTWYAHKSAGSARASYLFADAHVNALKSTTDKEWNN